MFRRSSMPAAHRLTGAIALIAVALITLVGCSANPSPSAPAAPPPPPPPPAIVGTWAFSIETPQGTQTPKFIVTGTADALSGVFSGEQGDTDVDGLTFADGQVTFSLSIDAGGQQLQLDFSGSLDGDSLSGSFGTPFGDFPATATREE